jgi:hypothetical protein
MVAAAAPGGQILAGCSARAAPRLGSRSAQKANRNDGEDTNMSGLSRVSLSNVRQGAVYMLVGLFWGMVVLAASFPRLALTARIQFTVNGVMFLVAGLVIAHLPATARGASARILIAGP